MRLYKLKGNPAMHPVFSAVFPLLARVRFCINSEKLIRTSWILILIDWCDWLHFLGKRHYFLKFCMHTLLIRVRVPFRSSSDRRPLPKLSMDWEWEEMVWHSSSKEQSLSRQIFISFSNLDNSPVTASSTKGRRKRANYEFKWKSLW